MLLTLSVPGNAATWTPLTNQAPGGHGTGIMMQLTDGTVLMQNGDDLQTWFVLTPDVAGNYANGTWSTTAPMTIARLYFGSQVLPNGKVFVVGGEYTGVNANGTFANWGNTAEIYDPVANTWTPLPPYPAQAGCPSIGNFTADTAMASNVLSNVYPQTAGLMGKTVIGTGIPSGTTVTAILNGTQVQISKAATSTNITDFLSLGASQSIQLSACFGDDPTILIPGGTAGQILAGDLVNGKTFLYDLATNAWSQTGTKLRNEPSDEEGWAKLSDGSILSYDVFNNINHPGGLTAQRYMPATGTWVDASSALNVPLSSNPLGFELGPVLRLQNGMGLVIGANQNTALYNPGTNVWTAGPIIQGSLHGTPANFGADDAPAAILPNGHVILAADAGPSPITSTGNTTNMSPVITNIPSTAEFYVNWSVSGAGIPGGAFIVSVDSPSQVTINAPATATGIPSITWGGIFSNPLQLFDYNPTTNTISPVSPALNDPNLDFLPAFVGRMLVLPTGQMLFSDSSSQLFIYNPDGGPSPILRPVVNNVAYNGGGVFTLTGKQLNGQNAGAAYGDDDQMDTNYPIVRMVSSTGNVYYGKTTNWSNFNVGISSGAQTVSFALNPNLTTPGNYSVIVSGAGIQSFPVIVNITQAEINKL
jgi:hypothetical protein